MVARAGSAGPVRAIARWNEDGPHGRGSTPAQCRLSGRAQRRRQQATRERPATRRSTMFTSDLTPVTPVTTTSTVERMQRTDTECRARARQFLIHLIGAMPDDLTWDHTHRLQGHAQLGGRQLVVIAPRDDASPHRRAHHAEIGSRSGARTANSVARCSVRAPSPIAVASPPCSPKTNCWQRRSQSRC